MNVDKYIECEKLDVYVGSLLWLLNQFFLYTMPPAVRYSLLPYRLTCIWYMGGRINFTLLSKRDRKGWIFFYNCGEEETRVWFLYDDFFLKEDI